MAKILHLTAGLARRGRGRRRLLGPITAAHLITVRVYVGSLLRGQTPVSPVVRRGLCQQYIGPLLLSGQYVGPTPAAFISATVSGEISSS
jgi:hypothetical protein